MALFVDVAVAVFISGDDDDVIAAVAVIAVATLSEVSVTIAVITDGIRNNVDISRITLGERRVEEEKNQHRTRTGC